MPQTLELPIEDTVCSIAEKHGWLVRKVSWVGRRAAPDRLFSKIVNGHPRPLLIEFKREGEDATIQQKREHERLRSAGFEVHVCDSIPSALKVLGI